MVIRRLWGWHSSAKTRKKGGNWVGACGGRWTGPGLLAGGLLDVGSSALK